MFSCFEMFVFCLGFVFWIVWVFIIFMNKSEIKSILKQHDMKPKKSLGQNFLIDKNIVKKIIETADLQKQDTILEVGAGLGILTEDLLKNTDKVIGIEKDNKLIEILEQKFKDYNNLKLLHKDILDLDVQKRVSSLEYGYKVVSNLPYYITSPVIRKFLEEETKPKSMILLVQKEVAQRICAAPPDMSLLAVSVQFYAKPKIKDYVSKNCFWPKPKVDSAILKIENIKKPDIDEKDFFKVVKAGFSKPRKQLAGNLSKSLEIDTESIKNRLIEMEVNPKARAEELGAGQWKELAEKINSSNSQ